MFCKGSRAPAGCPGNVIAQIELNSYSSIVRSTFCPIKCPAFRFHSLEVASQRRQDERTKHIIGFLRWKRATLHPPIEHENEFEVRY